MSRVALSTLTMAALVVVSGCCVPLTSYRDVDGYGGVYAADHCSGCDDCATGHQVPYRLGDGIRNLRRSLTCGGGCGEVYYGEWRNHPPDCPDPCDGCGNFNGARCGKCMPIRRVRNFFGMLLGVRYRTAYSNCSPSPCNDCCDGGAVHGDVHYGSGVHTAQPISARPSCNCGVSHSVAESDQYRAVRAQRKSQPSANQTRVVKNGRVTPIEMTPGERFAKQVSHQEPTPAQR